VIVLGADGAPRGAWVVAELRDGRPPRLREVPGPALLPLADELGADAVALDVPIGLPEDGTRACDVEARRALAGGGRPSSVFAAPSRRVLAAAGYAEARALQPSLSAQAFGLVPRIRDVDAALRERGPQAHRRVVECHPEVTFRQLTGHPLQRKKSAGGALQRIGALTDALGPLPRVGPVGAALDDALDALACAWTALRWAGGEAVVLGDEVDATGAPMRIVV
jgi:predicted RNase H-like nuclease